MNLQICSDLHIDYWHEQKQSDFIFDIFDESRGEILIIAGDLGEARSFKSRLYTQFFEIISNRFEKILYVSGNHEPYNGDWNIAPKILEALTPYPRIEYLDNRVVTIGDQRFVGTTLWSNLAHVDRNEIEQIHRGLNDYRVIRDSKKDYRRIDWSYTHQAFVRNRRFLEETILPGDVVITHHCPSYLSVHPMFAGSLLNACYASNLDDLIEEKSPALWVCGHTHHCHQYDIGTTRILCDSLGYPGENPMWNLEVINLEEYDYEI